MSFQGFEMMFPVIRVTDTFDESTHIVGTNSHDALYIGTDGQIHYTNLQNSEGSGSAEDDAYRFAGVDEEFSPWPVVEFVTLDELIEIFKAQCGIDIEREKEIGETIRRFRASLQQAVADNASNGIVHT